MLSTLNVLLQTRSVSRAAQRLGQSQPTTSRALSSLRQVFGDPLLVRSHRGMTLTARAHQLSKPLEEWLAAANSFLEPPQFEPASVDRGFSVASTDFGVLSVVLPTLPRISELAPNCRVEISAFSDDMFPKLLSGELDLIISGFEPDQSLAYSRHIFTETYSLIVRSDHPLAGRDPGRAVSLDEYLGWPHVAISIGEPEFDHVQFCLGNRGEERRIMARVPYFYAAPDLIGTSDAILAIPTRAARKFAQSYGFRCLAAPAEIKAFDYWVLWHECNARDPAIAWLIDRLAEAE